MHIKDPVVHVRLVDYGNTERPSVHFIIKLGLCSATLLQLAFLGESNLNFPWENSHWDNKVYKIYDNIYQI